MADAAGFLAMACDETVIHGNDVCSGLGLEFRPPDEVCERVVARLFPWAPEHDDSWERLLWCNGRHALPHHDRLGPEWGWWCAPLEEWDGTPYTDRSPGDWPQSGKPFRFALRDVASLHEDGAHH